MTVRSHGEPLEQTCQRPGLWHIEGYRVVRHKRSGLVTWWIYGASSEGDADLREVAPTLGKARDYIRTELNR